MSAVAESVTPARKRYMQRSREKAQARRVFICAACHLLADSTRAHAITCSTACRVRLHRNPALLAARNVACEQLQVSVSSVLEAGALCRLLPEAEAAVRDGTRTIASYRPQMCAALDRLLFEALAERSASQATAP